MANIPKDLLGPACQQERHTGWFTGEQQLKQALKDDLSFSDMNKMRMMVQAAAAAWLEWSGSGAMGRATEGQQGRPGMPLYPWWQEPSPCLHAPSPPSSGRQRGLSAPGS